VDACERRTCRQAGQPRRGAGGTRSRFSTRRTAVAPTLNPRPGSSPWIRR